MDNLTGKTLVFTDQHFGVKNNSPSRQKIGALVIKKILDTVSKDEIRNIIFCGDYFHQRNALTVDTLNIAYKCLQALAKKCNVYMVLGNHDLFNKNSTDVNSINIFRDNANVHVVDKPASVMLNNKSALLVPWLSDLSTFKEESYDFMLGHFEISSKFLVTSYIQEHSRTTGASDDATNEIDADVNLASSGGSQAHPEDYLGNFIDIVKRDGTVFAGHIHQHKELVARGRKFIFIGSPYEQNLGDIGCKCGYYVIDEAGKYEFAEIDGIPKHVQFKSSDVLRAGVDAFDFSSARGNIVQKVYDIDMPAEDDLKSSQKIASFRPYEELLPDYQVAVDITHDDSQHQDSLVKMLKKSKLDYIESYINQLDSKALEEASVDKDTLLNVMKKYYNAAVGD